MVFHADTFGQYLPEPKRKRKKNRPNFRRKKKRAPCRTTGCKNFAISRGRCMKCYQWLYNHGTRGALIEAADLAWGRKCCFKSCSKLGEGKHADGDFPLCDHHQCTIWLLMDLYEWMGLESPWVLPEDNDWHFARWVGHMREYTLSKGEDGSIYERCVSDSGVYRILYEGNKFWLPMLRSH